MDAGLRVAVVHQAEGVLAARLGVHVAEATRIMSWYCEHNGGDLEELAEQIVNQGLPYRHRNQRADAR